MKKYGADGFTKELLSRRPPCPPLIIYMHHEWVDEASEIVVMIRLIRQDGTEILGMASQAEADVAAHIHPKAAQWMTRLVCKPKWRPASPSSRQTRAD